MNISLDPSLILAIKSLDVSLKADNPVISESVNRTVLLGGKRLRPLLLFAMGKLFNLSVKELKVYAKAIEQVHGASLAHDDVIDCATKRRGRESINVSYGNKLAVLAGDYLLADVIANLSENGHLEILKELSQVIKDLSSGEWLQMDLIGKSNVTFEQVREVALKKTASVMSWCTLVPALVAGSSKEIVEKARNFGLALGLAFQYIDDTLDYSQYSEKDQGLDRENGILNSVIFEQMMGNDLESSLSRVKERARDEISRAKDLLTQIHESTQGPQSSLKDLTTILNLIANRKA